MPGEKSSSDLRTEHDPTWQYASYTKCPTGFSSVTLEAIAHQKFHGPDQRWMRGQRGHSSTEPPDTPTNSICCRFPWSKCVRLSKCTQPTYHLRWYPSSTFEAQA